MFRLLSEKLGKNIRLKIRRGNEERELDIPVGSVEIVTYRIVDSTVADTGTVEDPGKLAQTLAARVTREAWRHLKQQVDPSKPVNTPEPFANVVPTEAS